MQKASAGFIQSLVQQGRVVILSPRKLVIHVDGSKVYSIDPNHLEDIRRIVNAKPVQPTAKDCIKLIDREIEKVEKFQAATKPVQTAAKPVQEGKRQPAAKRAKNVVLLIYKPDGNVVHMSKKMKPEAYFHSESFNLFWSDKKLTRDDVDLSVKLPSIGWSNGRKDFDMVQEQWNRYHGGAYGRPPITSIVVGGKEAEQKYFENIRQKAE